MLNPCLANSSEVPPIFNSRKRASARGLRNTSLLPRDEKRSAVQYSVQPSICCHKLYFLPAFTRKYILTQMNEMITYAIKFVMDRINLLE